MSEPTGGRLCGERLPGFRGPGRARVGGGDQGGHGDDGRAEPSDATRGYVSVVHGRAWGHGNRPRNDNRGLSTFNASSKLGAGAGAGEEDQTGWHVPTEG
ncbi:hypothetical protein SY2F82_52690 [Streptomyces sp. Y2F8-2]|nr:hypothetical protein SY2F82_52690 [Streptomyces sp. Y2F8-2]